MTSLLSVKLKHGGMWCVNNEMLCLPFMTVALYVCIYFYVLYCFVFGCEWVGVHVGREKKKGVGVGLGE